MKNSLATLACVLLAGCAVSNGPSFALMNNSAPEIPRHQIDRIDGTYKGDATLVMARSPTCPRGKEGSVEIGDETLYFGYMPEVLFIAPVQPNGTVHAVAGPSVLDGRLVNGRLVFSVTTPACHTQYDLRWVL